MNGHLHNCSELLGLLGDYFDGELAEHLCEELEKHMRECEDCRIVVDTMKKTIDLYKEDANRSSEQLPQDVRSRLFYRLNLQEFVVHNQSSDSAAGPGK